MHKYIVMGAQGCGKGTQARLLSEALHLTHISVGDIFRWHIQSHTKLGARIKRVIAEGQLVPDEVVEEVVRQRLQLHDWNYGFILDGFPRNSPQAAFFLESYDIDAVLLIQVPDAVVQERILNRRLCTRCGLDYNLIFHRPAVANTCDVCGGALIARADDTPETVRGTLGGLSHQDAADFGPVSPQGIGRRCGWHAFRCGGSARPASAARGKIGHAVSQRRLEVVSQCCGGTLPTYRNRKPARWQRAATALGNHLLLGFSRRLAKVAVHTPTNGLRFQAGMFVQGLPQFPAERHQITHDHFL